MDPNQKISLCITTYNRVDMTLRSFAQVLDDPRVNDIVVMDDGSTDEISTELYGKLRGMEKVTLFRGRENTGVYQAKKTAISLAFHEWVILLDSDNIIGPDYIDCLYAIPEWKRGTAYLPSFARPTFDYRRFAGRTLTKSNAASWMGEPMFDCLINTMNGFYNSVDYLDVWNEGLEPLTADSMYLNYLLLKAGHDLVIVPGLEYEHTVHDGSHYKIHSHKNEFFRNQLLEDYKRLR